MGWLCYHTPPRDEQAEILSLCTFENDEGSLSPLAWSKVGTTWYVAVNVTLKQACETYLDYTVDPLTNTYVFAAVFLTRRGGGEWCYKHMDESCGPNDSNCPKKILKLLSPTEAPYAQEWRQRCWATADQRLRKLEHGDLIALDEALRFQDGRKRQFFKVQIEKPAWAKHSSKVFLCLETGNRCRISGITKRGWSKINPSNLHWVVEHFTLCDGFTIHGPSKSVQAYQLCLLKRRRRPRTIGRLLWGHQNEIEDGDLVRTLAMIRRVSDCRDVG